MLLSPPPPPPPPVISKWSARGQSVAHQYCVTVQGHMARLCPPCWLYQEAQVLQTVPRSAACVSLAARACAAADGPWRLQWADDFTAPTLNAAFWTVRDNATHGDRQL